MGHVYSNADLFWKKDWLHAYGIKKPLVQIVPDEKYPKMWRVVLADGSLSGMLNKTRAADAARVIALRSLNAA